MIDDLLIEFDEMGFEPTTVCPNPEVYATEWREKVRRAFKRLKAENAALIAAGFGDVKEAKFGADHYWRMWQGALVELGRAEHRAEVAEKAGRIIQRDMVRVFDVSNPRICELIANIWDFAKKQAEKELQKERWANAVEEILK